MMRSGMVVGGVWVVLALLLVGVGGVAQAEEDPGAVRLGQFSVKDLATRDAIAQLAKQAGVTIRFAPGVEAAEAKALAQPVTMVMRGSSVRQLLEIMLQGSSMLAKVHEGAILISSTAARAGEGQAVGGLAKKDPAGPDCVLVVEFAKRDGISYGPMRGAVLWFKVIAVMRLIKATKVSPQRQRFYAVEYPTLVKRSTALDRYRWLEVNAEHFRDSAAGKATLARLSKGLVVGQRYVLARTSTVGMSAMAGTVRDGKWGRVRAQGLHRFPDGQATLDDIDALFIKARAAHKGEETDVTVDRKIAPPAIKPGEKGRGGAPAPPGGAQEPAGGK